VCLDGLIFLVRHVVDLRYIEQEAQIGRALNVLKMRNSHHQTTLTSFTIADQGITIGQKLEGVTGRLGWTALRTQDWQHATSRPPPTSPAEDRGDPSAADSTAPAESARHSHLPDVRQRR